MVGEALHHICECDARNCAAELVTVHDAIAEP